MSAFEHFFATPGTGAFFSIFRASRLRGLVWFSGPQDFLHVLDLLVRDVSLCPPEVGGHRRVQGLQLLPPYRRLQVLALGMSVGTLGRHTEGAGRPAPSPLRGSFGISAGNLCSGQAFGERGCFRLEFLRRDRFAGSRAGTRQGKAGKDRAGPGQDQDKARQGRTGHDRTGPGRTGPGRPGPARTGADRGGPGRARADPDPVPIPSPDRQTYRQDKTRQDTLRIGFFAQFRAGPEVLFRGGILDEPRSGHGHARHRNRFPKLVLRPPLGIQGGTPRRPRPIRRVVGYACAAATTKERRKEANR